MPLIELVAPAKINLGLAVESRRSDGFHNLVSVFQTVSWADRLSFYHADDVTFTCDRAELSTGPDNLVMRAASLLRERFALREGADDLKPAPAPAPKKTVQWEAKPSPRLRLTVWRVDGS